MLDSWDHNSRDRPQAEPQLVRRHQADPDRDPHDHARRPGRRPGRLSRPASSTWSRRPARTSPASRTTRSSDQVLQVPALSITYYTYNNFQDNKLKSFKTPGPTANKDFRIALTQAIDKQAFIDATFAGVGAVANSFVMPGIPGYQADLDPYPYDLASAKDHMAKALAALGVQRGRPRQAQVRLQLRRRPRAARRLPGRSLAAGVRSRDRADRLRLQRLPHPAHRRATTTSPATAGVPTTRTRTTSSTACSPAAAATTTASTATPTSTR